MTTLVDAWDTDFDPMEIDTSVDHDGIETELSMLEVAGLAVAGVTALNGVAVLTAAAPAYTAVMGVGAGALGWTGYRKRKGLPVIPGQTEEKQADAKTTPAPVSSTKKGAVVDATGNDVDIEGL